MADPEFEKELRDIYVQLGPQGLTRMARIEHSLVLARDEFLKEFIEWASYMGFDGDGMRLRIKAKRLLGMIVDDGEELEYLGEHDDE